MRNSFSFVSVLLCMLLFVTSVVKRMMSMCKRLIFESLSIPSAGYWNGSDATGSFTSSGMKFDNQYNAAWQSWSGFPILKRTMLQLGV